MFEKTLSLIKKNKENLKSSLKVASLSLGAMASAIIIGNSGVNAHFENMILKAHVVSMGDLDTSEKVLNKMIENSSSITKTTYKLNEDINNQLTKFAEGKDFSRDAYVKDKLGELNKEYWDGQFVKVGTDNASKQIAKFYDKNKSQLIDYKDNYISTINKDFKEIIDIRNSVVKKSDLADKFVVSAHNNFEQRLKSLNDSDFIENLHKVIDIEDTAKKVKNDGTNELNSLVQNYEKSIKSDKPVESSDIVASEEKTQKNKSFKNR